MAKTEKKGLSANQYVITVFVCGLSFGILLALNAARSQIAGIPVISELFTIASIFESPMYFAMPFFGFFAIFFLVEWANRQFDTELAAHPVFPAVFFVIALAAYYVALYWYVASFAALQGIEMSPELVDFWGKLHTSSFYLFVWAGVFGWITRYSIEKINL